MEFPLITFCDGDILIFSSKDFAENYIEPIDVENNEWIVFDVTGKKLALRIVTHRSRIPFFSKAWVEVLEPSSSNPGNRDECKQLFIASIQTLSDKEKSRLGFPVSDELLNTTPFEQLLLLAQKAFQKH